MSEKGTEMIKAAIKRSAMKQEDVAKAMGWSKSGLCVRLKNRTVDADEFIDMMELMGYTVDPIPKDGNGDTTFRKTSSLRVREMVDKTIYDTQRAVMIIRTPNIGGCHTELMRDTVTSDYFTVFYHPFNGGGGKIVPCTKDEAVRLAIAFGAEDETIKHM